MEDSKLDKVIKGLEWILEGDRFGFGVNWYGDCVPQCEEEQAGYNITRAIELLKSQKDALEQMRLDNQDLRQCNSEMRAEIDRLKAYVPIPSIADTPIYCSDGIRKDGDVDG